MSRPVALTIAGSDSGGGAGIQADLRTMTALGVHGTSVITCVTAQNLDEVTSVAAVSPRDVEAQMEAVLRGFPVRAAKTGMLFSRAIIEAVARSLDRHGELGNLVVDPVMVAASGARLLEPDAENAYAALLLPRAVVITPNLDEAAVLLRAPIRDAEAVAGAAEALGRRFGTSVLVKGGHLEGDPGDVLWHAGTLHRWTAPRVHGVHSHGSGCVLSAAIAARLARGDDLVAAAAAAHAFLQASFRSPLALESGAVLLGIPDRA
jgi:hydroxymethylpyrimidine/phosphomethylpyrimidine kinase